MKKLITTAIAIVAMLTTSCAGTTTAVSPELRDWFKLACEIYEDARPVIVVLLDAAEKNPDIVPAEYRDDVKKFREETGPKLDRGLKLLCQKAEGQNVDGLIAEEKSGADWNAVAMNAAKVATVA